MTGSADTCDAYGARTFGSATFAGFDPRDGAQCRLARSLAERLAAIGFGAATAAERFGLRELVHVVPSRSAFYDAFVLAPDSGGRAARFFVLHDVLDEPALDALLGAALVTFLAAMGAIVRADGGWRSLVSATWFGGELILADARAYNLIWPGEPFGDYVMPPGADSLGLMHVTPQRAQARVLDLCCGPGTQALVAARRGGAVVGVDRNARALRFARFNAALNGITNVDFRAGDLDAPLAAERYDCIMANPPFVPWPSEDDVQFRGGGSLGDNVVARIVAIAAARLEPGGILAMVADFANSETLPERLITWAGTPRRTLVLFEGRYGLIEYAERHAAHHDDRLVREAEIVRMLRHFEAVDLRTLDVGYVLMQQASGATTVLHTTAARTDYLGADVDDWFRHQARVAEASGDDRLRLAPGLRLVDVATRNAEGEVRAEAYVAPGPASVQAPDTVSRSAFALLIAIANGSMRVRDVSDSAAALELGALLARGVVRFV